VVAAQARARLAGAAAELWDVPADEVEFERGVVRHSSGREATFAQLAVRAEQLPVPDGVEPKDLSEYKLIGGEGRLASTQCRKSSAPLASRSTSASPEC
jgi:hypothetical protein